MALFLLPSSACRPLLNIAGKEKQQRTAEVQCTVILFQCPLTPAGI
jgi:hypothetical protein